MAGDQVKPLCTICGGRFCTELMAKRYLGGGELLKGLAAINVSPAELERMTKDDEHVWWTHDFFESLDRKTQVGYVMTCFDGSALSFVEVFLDNEAVPLYESCDVIRAKNSKQS